MRRISRVVTVAMVLIGVAPMVAGCADGDFDMDKLDVLGLNAKKPLPGKREPVFPGGVPGVEQGIPPEYMKGNLAEQPGAAVPVGPLPQTAAAPNAQAAAAAPVEPVREKPKPKPKKRVVRKPTRVRVAPVKKPEEQPAQAQQPAAAQPAQAQQGLAPWPTQNQSAPAPWPSAPPPGTFSK